MKTRELDSTVEVGRSARKTDRQDAVAQSLRDRIVGGEFAPGSRLPTRIEIEAALGVSSVTVQRALEQLKDEGCVVARGRRGTYVSEEPPHLSHYALVFPCHVSDPEWNMFWTAIRQEAAKIETHQSYKLPVFYGVDGHEDSEDYQRLIRAVQNHGLVGIILASEPSNLLHTPIFTEKGIARIAVADADEKVLDTARIYPDLESLCRRAVETLAAQKRQRIAVVKQLGFDFDFEALIAQHGLITHSYWIQDVSLWAPATARKVMHLMMHDKERERPDALVVTDDNMLEPVLLGLRDAGVRVPEELTVVAHGNFPLATPASAPVQRVGFDISQLVQACIQEINQQRRGQPIGNAIRLPARFEEEVGSESVLH